MLSERKIVELIFELEERDVSDPSGGFGEEEFDEGEQSRLETLWEVLDRPLTKSEEEELEQRREKFAQDIF